MLAFTAVWMHYKRHIRQSEDCERCATAFLQGISVNIVVRLCEDLMNRVLWRLQAFFSSSLVFSMRRIPKDITVCNIGRFQNVILYCMNADIFFFHCVCVCVCVCVVGGRVGVFRRRWVISDKKLFWVYGWNILDAFLIPGEIWQSVIG